MFKGYTIIDADGHVHEPLDLWEKRLDPETLAQAPQHRGRHWFYKGQKVPPNVPEVLDEEFKKRSARNYKEAIALDWNAESHVKGMTAMGIDVSYLYPTTGLGMWAYKDMDPKVAKALVCAYNDWLFEFASYNPEVLKPVPGVSLHDPKDAVEEMRRVVDMGARAIFVRPNPINGRTIGDPAYEELWSECEERNIGVGVHEGGGALPRVADGRFTTQFACHTNHVTEQMLAFLAVLEKGVLERHPTLRFAFLESGCGWLPFWLWRLDEIEYKTNGLEVEHHVKMKPSEYFKRQCYVSPEDEPYLGALVEYIGEDQMLFASDYPHPDHGPGMTQEIVEMEDLVGKRVLEKMLYHNPLAFYGEAEPAQVT
jgi:predicted TIM-barrel fold metal-dependent hydrolase